MIFLFDRVENTMEKGENAGYQRPFIKREDCVVELIFFPSDKF